MAASQDTEMSKARPKSLRTKKWIKLGVLTVFVASVAILYANYGELLSLNALASRESLLRQHQREHPLLVYSVAFVTYVAVTALSIPGATVLTLLYGWFFGFWRAVLLVSFASTAGATLAFLLARFFLRDIVQRKWGGRLQIFNAALEREGAFYLFTLRLILVVPFFVINLVMGLTPMRTRTFWGISQLGMLPATCIYVYAGFSVPDLATLAERGVGSVLTPQLFLALALLGLFPLAVRKVMQVLRPRAVETVETTAHEIPGDQNR